MVLTAGTCGLGGRSRWLALVSCYSCFACVEPTELRRSLPPTLVEQPLSAADQQASVPSGWRLGQTWMLKEYCSAGAIRSRRQLSGFRTDWPAYWHFEIVGEAPDAFVLSRTLLEHPDSGLASPEFEEVMRAAKEQRPSKLRVP